MKPTRQVALALVTLLLLFSMAACGSTNLDKRAQAGNGDEAAAATDDASSTDVSTGAEGATATEVTTATGETVPGAAATPGATIKPGSGTKSAAEQAPTSKTAGAAKPGGYAGPFGPGISDKEIKIGISTFVIGSYGQVIGTNNDAGNTEHQAQVVVDYVNAHGGIAGRKVVPVYYEFNFDRAATLGDGGSEQEACARWTEDNKVFAVINNTMARFSLLECLAARNTIGVHDAIQIAKEHYAKLGKFWYTGPGMVLDRQAELQVKVLGDKGFFKGATVGVLHYEDPVFKKVVDNIMVPKLKEYGVTKVVTQAAPRAPGDQASYVTKMRSEGVTHMLFLGESQAYPMYFMGAAESQQYRPKYGLSTLQTPAFLLQDIAPAEQLKNAVGFGWGPIFDTDAAHDPGPVNAQNKLCMDMQSKEGEDTSNRQALLQMLTYCNSLWFLQRVITAAPSLNVAGVSESVSKLGTSFVSPMMYATSYSGAKHDGVTHYRDFAFPDGKCAYTSGVKKLPDA